MNHAPTLDAHLTYDLVQLAAAEQTFRQQFPGFAETRALDQLRATEYARLDEQGQVYLDWMGGGLYGDSQVRDHLALLRDHVFGNPHSRNPTSQAMTRLVEQARDSILRFFRADPDEYTVVFTPNASGALKLVGEAFPFAPGGRFTMAADNHNSVLGIREFARARGATVRYLPTLPPDMRLDPDWVAQALGEADPAARNLFAFPAQSNFTGVQHPLGFIEQAQAAGWEVLLDAAAFVPTNRLDLSAIRPDFVSLSFYKMFGYPTGVGALVARRSALRRLRRPWFAGGTVASVSVQGDGHFLVDSEAAFEDGTVNYLSLPAVEIGLRHLDQVGIETIHERVRYLTGWLLEQVVALRHSNGARLVCVHGPLTTEARGGTIAFNFLDPAGRAVDMRVVEARASEARISLRTGYFCNPGAGEVAYGLTERELGEVFQRGNGLSFQELRRFLAEQFRKEVGAVRVSVGLASTFADAYRFMAFAATLRDRTVLDLGDAPLDCAPLPERDAV